MSKHLADQRDCILYVCCGSKCRKRGGKDLYKQLKTVVKERSLKKIMQVIKTGCTDNCKTGPVIAVMPANEWHLHMDERKTAALVDELADKLI
jgi:NADH:ubiquinone oxidoreductase subunit E